MKILITGGAGFFGSHLIHFHLEKGDEVRAVDNLSAGRKENLAPFIKHPRFSFFKLDVCDLSPELKESVAWADRIYHMAAMVGQKLVLNHPAKTLSQNIRGCDVMFQALAETKSKARITIASSSGLYAGEPLAKEDAVLQFPPGTSVQQSYRLSKLVNEMAALDYIREHGGYSAIPRIFNTTGLHHSSAQGMGVPLWIEEALKGRPLTIYGNGKQTRTFCNVKDVVKGLHLLLEMDQCNGEIINLGHDQEISMLDLASLIKDLTKSSSPIVFMSYKEALGFDYQETMRCKPDLTKLKKFTGFKPEISLEETLREMIAEIKDRI